MREMDDVEEMIDEEIASGDEIEDGLHKGSGRPASASAPIRIMRLDLCLVLLGGVSFARHGPSIGYWCVVSC